MMMVVVFSLACILQHQVFGECLYDPYHSYLVVNTGDRVILWCTDHDLSQLRGKVTLTWEQGHKTIPVDDSRLDTVANGTLELNNVQREDTGIYRCTVEAQCYEVVNTTYLLVRETYKYHRFTFNRMSDLQTQIEALLNDDDSDDVAVVITKFVNLTDPENKQNMNTNELSSSVDILEQLVMYNAVKDNKAFTTPADQRNILVAGSNLLDEKNTETWLRLQKNRENVTDVLLETMDVFASQIVSQLDRSTNSTSLVLSTKNIGIRVDQVNANQTLDIDFFQYGSSVLFPGSVFTDSPTNVALVVAYKTVHKILRLKREVSTNELEKRPDTSSIISAKIISRPTSPLKTPFKLVFDHNNKGSDVIGQCVFWEIDQPQRTWLTRGCVRVDHESNASSTTCECDHLTIFSVLFNNKPIDGSKHHQPYLTHISTIGCACSLVFLLLTFAVIIFCWKQVKSVRTVTVLNLCVAIAASCLLILLAEHARRPKALCTITATFLHYFLLCVFSWMLCHGVILYFLIIRAETRETLEQKMKWLYAFGWGSPLSIVVISLIVTGTKLNTANNCWLTPEHGFIYWAFAAPAATVIIINSILLIFLVRQINSATKFRTSMSRARPCAKRVKAWLRRIAMLLPVLGVTWLFGFLTFITSTAVIHYLFTILNSLQGFFIFVTFCILDDAVRETLIGRLSKWNAISPKEQSGLNSRITVLKITARRIQTVQSATMTATNQHGATYDLTNDAKESKISEPKLQTWIAADV